MSSEAKVFDTIVAKSEAMHDIFATVEKIAPFKTTVLIQGESGTGKELVAKAIHNLSPRKNKKFVAINCGAIPENLLESELFGHKSGAFTDATKDKKGLFEEAENGTIFLDEIGELPAHLQVKLLRVLQEGTIRPVGSSTTTPIDVRVVAATLRNLDEDILEGRFRDDLFYRLNVVTIVVPALRERKDDIEVLANYFLDKNKEKLNLDVKGITEDALEVLYRHSWNGNVRELENCIERSMIMTTSDEITVDSLPKTITKSESSAEGNTQFAISDDRLSIKYHTRILEESLIKRALDKTNGNRTHAAKLLEISHRTLLYKLKEYKLSEE